MIQHDNNWTIKSIINGHNSFNPINSPLLQKPLSQRQYNFVNNYIKNGFNAYQAAIDSGYARNTARYEAHKLIHKDNIKAQLNKAIVKVENKLITKLGVSIEWRMKKLKRVIEEFIPDDKSISLKSNDVKTGLQALSEMNKMFGDYAPDKRLSVTVDATSDKMKEARKVYDEY